MIGRSRELGHKLGFDHHDPFDVMGSTLTPTFSSPLGQLVTGELYRPSYSLASDVRPFDRLFSSWGASNTPSRPDTLSPTPLGGHQSRGAYRRDRFFGDLASAEEHGDLLADIWDSDEEDDSSRVLLSPIDHPLIGDLDLLNEDGNRPDEHLLDELALGG